MTLKINPIVATLLIAGVLILLVALIKGCNNYKKALIAEEKAVAYGDSMKAALNIYKIISDSSKKQFQDSLEFERGHSSLIEAQKAVTEMELDKFTKQNKDLIAKHKFAQYTDTTATLVPAEYITDCEGCFTKLETTTNIANRYKDDVNKLQTSWNKQSQLYENRFKELDQEKLGFTNKINTLAKAQQEAVNKLKPHGRLYLSWGVLWSYWPTAAGFGLKYQTKRNLLIGVMGYYGVNKTTVETTINFPLSLRFK